MIRVSNATWDAFVNEPSEGTFRRLYEESSLLVYTVCVRILRHEGDACDAFQSTYCRLLAAAKEGRREPAAGELVLRTAVREADALRHRRDRRARKEVPMGATHEDRGGQGAADEIAARRQIRERVEGLVETLPEKYRLPVALHYFDGLTHDEIAAAVGATRSAVSNRIARGLRTLEPALKRAGLGETAVVLGALVATQGLNAAPASLNAAAVFANAQAVLAQGGAAALAGTATASGTAGVSALAAFAAAVKTKAALVVCAALVAAAAGTFVVTNVWRSADRPTTDAALSASESGGGAASASVSKLLQGPNTGASRRAEKALASVDGGTSIFGRITIAGTGAPASGATVIVVANGPRATARAEQDGSYELKGLSAGDVRIVAVKGAYISHLREADVAHSAVNEGQRNGPYDLALRRGLVARGKVTDEATGAAIAGARIATTLLEDLAVVSGADGAYRMEGLPAMELSFDVRAQGFARIVPHITPREEGANVYDFALEKEGIAAVLVTDADGKPLPGAKVAFFIEESFVRGDQSAVTGADGRVNVSGLSVRTPPRLTASKDGYQQRDAALPRFEGDSRHAQVTIVMRPTERAPARGAFAGRVVDQEGKAVAGARVAWSRVTHPNNGASGTTTDAEGRYRLEVPADMQAGFQLGVAATRFAPARRRDVTPGTKGSPATVNFTLESGHSLEGIVLGPDKAPRAGVFVCPYLRGEDMDGPNEILGQPGAVGPYRTDGAGRFRMENLPAGEILLDLWGAGLSDVRKLACAAGTSVSIAMKSAGVIKGRVIDGRSGAPIRVFLVKISGGNIAVSRSGPGQTFSSDDGRFLLNDLNQEASYTLTIQAARFPPFVRTDVSAVALESEREETFALVSGNALSGLVVDALSEKPIASATVVAAVADQGFLDWGRLEERGDGRPQPPVRAATDDAGSFVLEEGNRPLTLFARAKGYARLVMRPEDRAGFVKGEGRELRIALAPAAAIAGTLLVAKEALANAELHLSYEGHPPCALERMYSDTAGAFRFDELGAGPYRLTVYRQKGRIGFGWVSRSITLRAGTIEQITIGNDFGTCALSGRVLDAEGKPIADARVSVNPKFASAYGDFADYTDADGAYRVMHLEPGAYLATVWKYVESGSGLRELRTSAAVTVEGETRRDFAFAARHKVTARVRAEEAPAAKEAHLSMSSAGAVRTDGVEGSSSCRISEGRIVFEGLFRGVYRLEVARRGAARSEARYHHPDTLALDTGASDVDLGEIALPPLGARSFSGEVLGPNDDPIPAMLTLTPAFKWEYAFLRGWSDEQGRFRIEGARDGTYALSVVCQARSGAVQRRLARTIEIRGATEETIRFDAEHTVTAQLRFDENAAWGANVTSVALSRIGWDSRVPYADDGTLNLQSGTVRGDHIGFMGRLKGEYILEIACKSEKNLVYLSLPGTFALDNLAGDQDLGEVRVPSSEEGRLAVALAFEGAERPEYGFAYLFPNGDRRRKHLCTLDLRAATQELGPIPAGTYEVAVGAPGFRCEPPFLGVKIGAGAAAPACAFRLVPQGVVKGYVSFDVSPRIREARIEGAGVSRTIRPAEGASPACDMMLAQGDLACASWFVFANLPAGTFTVTVTAEGCEPASQTVDITPGKERSVSFDLRAAGE